MKTRFLAAILALAFFLTGSAIDPEIPDNIKKKCSVVSLEGQQTGIELYVCAYNNQYTKRYEIRLM